LPFARQQMEKMMMQIAQKQASKQEPIPGLARAR
jgi:hypothetical protein